MQISTRSTISQESLCLNRYETCRRRIQPSLLSLRPSQPGGPVVSKEPISVRGLGRRRGRRGMHLPPTVETEAARKAQLYQSINVWIEGAPYRLRRTTRRTVRSLLLDVPPGNVTISFAAPGAPDAKLVLQNIPGNADVYVPALILAKNSVKFADPAAVQVRMAAQIDKPPSHRPLRRRGRPEDRHRRDAAGAAHGEHEFPTPPGGGRPPRDSEVGGQARHHSSSCRIALFLTIRHDAAALQSYLAKPCGWRRRRARTMDALIAPRPWSTPHHIAAHSPIFDETAHSWLVAESSVRSVSSRIVASSEAALLASVHRDTDSRLRVPLEQELDCVAHRLLLSQK